MLIVTHAKFTKLYRAFTHNSTNTHDLPHMLTKRFALTHTYLHTDTYIHTYRDTYIYIHIHTYTHTYIHTLTDR